MKFQMKKSVDAEHSPIPSLNEGVKELIHLYSVLGPLETQAAYIEDQLETLREVFVNHKCQMQIHNGLDALGKWIEKNLPKDIPNIIGVYYDDSNFESEYSTSDQLFRDWHPLKGHRISEHPNAQIVVTVDFTPTAFHSEDEFEKYCEHHITPWFDKHGMKMIDIEHQRGTGDEYIAIIMVFVFTLDVEITP